MPDKNKMELTTTAISANRLGTALGFLSNGYQYEVTGIMNLIFQLEYGNQYSSFLEYSLTGAPLFGVLIGQLFFGIVADIHGRKAGLVITSSFVVIGAIISTASYGSSVNGLSLSLENQWKNMIVVWRGYWPCIVGCANSWFIRDFETFSISTFGASILHEIRGSLSVYSYLDYSTYRSFDGSWTSSILISN
ncbi:hypothetical protein Gasu2_28690 [Galdieria sulphuraria]|nr:hypothetical protein Gasu2_28690 [Galdieria sulphuraria]